MSVAVARRRPAPAVASFAPAGPAAVALARSLEAAQCEDHPFPRLHLRNPLPPRVLAGLAALPFEPPPALAPLGGPRACVSRTHPLRGPEALRFAVCRAAADAFAAEPVVALLERRLAVDLQGCTPRFGVVHHADGYVCAPRTGPRGVGVRLVIALGPSCDVGLGPDLYLDGETWAAQLPWGPGLAFAFAPGPETWHGFEPRLIRRLRSLLVVDYAA
ncbi:MAG: hypothetical protein JWQ97_467 [Phenylobacterium sp.]|nr:hypothetical protein [Phenylobacterium sp.]